MNEATEGIEVDAGEETGHITEEFIAEDGDVLDFDDEVYLEVDVADEAVAAFEQDSPGERPDR